jgi:uncharacterized protein (DUF924 family)
LGKPVAPFQETAAFVGQRCKRLRNGADDGIIPVMTSSHRLPTPSSSSSAKSASTAVPAAVPTTSAEVAPVAPVTPQSVLDFWFSDSVAKRWFTGGADLDEEIRSKFGAQVALAQSGGLAEWEAEPQSRLALVIVLDQFSRNIFRGKSKAFAGDERAQQLVTDALARGFDEKLSWMGRVFLYMPLMHAESLALQEESVKRFTALEAAVPHDLRASVQSSLDYARQHRDIIARLGRFPYRNAALGRTNTALEFDFLKNGPRFGQ